MWIEKLGTHLPFLQNGIAQVGILVEDLDQAVETYWKVGKIGPWQIYTYQRPLVKAMNYRGKPADYKMRIALTWVNALCIELIQVLDGESIYQESSRKKDTDCTISVLWWKTPGRRLLKPKEPVFLSSRMGPATG